MENTTATVILLLLSIGGCSQQSTDDTAAGEKSETSAPQQVADANDPTQLARKQLEGTWDVISSRVDGKPIQDAVASRFVFAGDSMTMIEKDQSIEGRFALDVSQEPHRLTLSPSVDVELKAIYSLDGGNLVICFGLLPGAPVPTDLTSEEGDGRVLVTLRRSAPNGEET